MLVYSFEIRRRNWYRNLTIPTFRTLCTNYSQASRTRPGAATKHCVTVWRQNWFQGSAFVRVVVRTVLLQILVEGNSNP